MTLIPLGSLTPVGTECSRERDPVLPPPRPSDSSVVHSRLSDLKNRGQLIRGGLDFFHTKDRSGFLRQFENALAQAHAALQEIDPNHLIP